MVPPFWFPAILSLLFISLVPPAEAILGEASFSLRNGFLKGYSWFGFQAEGSFHHNATITLPEDQDVGHLQFMVCRYRNSRTFFSQNSIEVYTCPDEIDQEEGIEDCYLQIIFDTVQYQAARSHVRRNYELEPDTEQNVMVEFLNITATESTFISDKNHRVLNNGAFSGVAKAWLEQADELNISFSLTTLSSYHLFFMFGNCNPQEVEVSDFQENKKMQIEVEYSNMNPNGEHLSVGYLEYKPYYKTMSVFWLCVVSFWMGFRLYKKFLRGENFKIIHGILLLNAVFFLIHCLIQESFWEYYSSKGQPSYKLWVLSLLFSSIAEGFFFALIMLIAKGHWITKRKIRRRDSGRIFLMVSILSMINWLQTLFEAALFLRAFYLMILLRFVCTDFSIFISYIREKIGEMGGYLNDTHLTRLCHVLTILTNWKRLTQFYAFSASVLCLLSFFLMHQTPWIYTCVNQSLIILLFSYMLFEVRNKKKNSFFESIDMLYLLGSEPDWDDEETPGNGQLKWDPDFVLPFDPAKGLDIVPDLVLLLNPPKIGKSGGYEPNYIVGEELTLKKVPATEKPGEFRQTLGEDDLHDEICTNPAFSSRANKYLMSEEGLIKNELSHCASDNENDDFVLEESFINVSEIDIDIVKESGLLDRNATIASSPARKIDLESQVIDVSKINFSVADHPKFILRGRGKRKKSADCERETRSFDREETENSVERGQLSMQEE